MINAKQLRDLIIRPTLERLSPEIPYSTMAVELLMMTAAHESKLGTYIAQVKGPALGIYQMEPNTWGDIDGNFLGFRPSLYKAVNFASGYKDVNNPDAEDMIGNLYYATAMARIHYYRVPEALPSKPEDMAEYAKKYYNTSAGKATSLDYLEAYMELC